MLEISDQAFQIEKYRQIASSQNMRYLPSFYVNFTLAEVPFTLRLEFDELKLEGENATPSKVTAFYYEDENFGFYFTKQSAQTAMRLLVSVMK